MSPYDFQELVAALLRAMDYHIAWVSPPGPDQGLDILAYTDPLGATGPRIKVQVKRRADKLPVDGLRAFMALLGGQDVGIFIPTGASPPRPAGGPRPGEPPFQPGRTGPPATSSPASSTKPRVG